MLARAAVLFLMGFLCGCRHAPDAPARQPVPRETSARPVLVLLTLESYPIASSPGAESPDFALYEDGTAIFLKRDASYHLLGYHAVKLGKAEQEELLASLPLRELNGLEAEYKDVGTRHTPATTLLHWTGNERKQVTVWGRLCPARLLEVLPEEERGRWCPERDRQLVPLSFLAVYERLSRFDPPTAQRWLPRDVEVWVWDFSHSKVEPRPWPVGWPDLASPGARQPEAANRGVGRVLVPGERLEEVARFVESLGNSQAALMRGKLWAVDYRIPFPGERLWITELPDVH